MNELLQVKESGEQENGTYKLGNWEFNSLEDLESKIKETYDTWQGDIKETYSLESSLADLRAEQYKAELNVIKDLIDAKKKALNSEKDLHDYQKSIQEKTNDISAIQKQIIAYSGDSSQEGLAKLQKLQKELADRQEDLAETEYDRYISDQQDMLDKLYEEYEELMTKKIEDFDKNVQDALKLANDNLSVITDYLSRTAESKGYSMENTNLSLEPTDDTKNTLAAEIQEIPEFNWSDFLQKISNKVSETIAAVTDENRMLLALDSASHLDSTSGRIGPNNVVNIDTLTLPNVTNYEEFRDKMFHDMQSSPKFENMLNGLTVNRLSGSGRLDKYKYRP